MDQGKNRVTSGSAWYFDKVATEYASKYRARSPEGYALRVRQQRLIELLDHSRGRVLDVGCGPGILALELFKSGFEVWGVDASPNMIKECQRTFKENDQVHFVISDAKHLPFSEGFFDTVICMGVIDRIQENESVLREITRILKKDGMLYITLPNLYSPYAAWKNFFFYPTVALLRPLYYGLKRRSPPPSLYTHAGRQLLRLFLYFAKLHTPNSGIKLLARHGIEMIDISYFNFNLFLSPLDQIFPKWAIWFTQRIEQYRFGRLKWLGSGFILKAKKGEIKVEKPEIIPNSDNKDVLKNFPGNH